MKLNKIPLLLLIATLLYSCDPGQILEIKVANKQHLSVMIYGNGNILPHSSDKNEKVVLRVPSTDTSNDYDRTFIYRIGTWGDDAIFKFSNNIDSIILNTSSGKIIMSKKDVINKYLLQHRSGGLENVLTIEVN